jgi:hypothetical protein
MHSRYNKNTKILVALLAFSIVATALLVISHAATPYLAIEPEAAVLSGSARVFDGYTASGTKYVEFCKPPTVFPNAPNGALTYLNWYFTIPDINSVSHTVTSYNDSGNTSDIYLQLYDASIDGTGQYYGLQTTGMAIFSRFGTIDTSNIQAGPGATITNGTNEGPYISLRYDFGSMPTGTYNTRMVRTSYDGLGDWFSYFVKVPERSSETYIGAIRFPRANASVPASFADGGGTWTEFWDNNGTTLLPVPTWHTAVLVTANGNTQPRYAMSSYSAMPNSDQYADVTTNGLVHQVIGGSTPRCHPAGQLW